jgi:S1-C subfamily serine protease
MANELTALSNAMADAVEKAGAYTVLVDARRRFPATGIAFDKEHILTANHVVEYDEDIKVILPDGAELAAEVAGRDPGSDLVLLKLEKASAAPAEVVKDPARPGQLSLALGRPTSEGVQASFGIVSAVGGAVRTRSGGMLEGYLRTDAIPYPGFSGGPLIDADGKVIGINTSGLGFSNSIAIPAHIAWKIAASLKEHGSVKRGFLGVRSQPVELDEAQQKALGREQAYGLLLVGIEPDSPAAKAKLMVGDILVGLNDQPAENADELFALLNGDVVGKPTPIEVLRGGKRETLKVTVAERQEAPPREGRNRGWHGYGPGRRRGRRRAHFRGR